jgi:hypothetical protein
VLSNWRHNDGPKQPKILVTHLPETVPARQRVGIYLRRWAVARRGKELKGGVGLGQHPVTKQATRVARAVASAILASWLLLKLRAQEMTPNRPWSAFRLQRAFAWEVMPAQCERSARQMAYTWRQIGNAA